MDHTTPARRARAPRIQLRLPRATPRSQTWLARGFVVVYALMLAAGIVSIVWFTA